MTIDKTEKPENRKTGKKRYKQSSSNRYQSVEYRKSTNQKTDIVDEPSLNSTNLTALS